MSVPVVRFVVAGREVRPRVPPRDYTVIYDGSCNVCTRQAELLRKWDHEAKLTVIPSQGPGVQARFPWIPAEAFAESIQVIAANGRTFQGARAVEELVNVLPRWKWLAWIFRIPFIRPLAEKLYRWFARNRYKFGCGDHCSLKPSKTDYQDVDAGS